MEASAIRAPVGLARISLSGPLLRLRTDDQLVALFRAGDDDAFRVLYDRHRQRVFAYARQMLAGSRQDAEDAMQDVFIRAYSALRADDRPVAVRAWLYRVAHNRCIDQLRRPLPPPAEVFEMARPPLQDPLAVAERREHLARLVADVRRLPEQQRSALLMRELDGLSYAEIATALEVSVAAVKSLLVRARLGLTEAGEARDSACSEIRHDLALAHRRGVRATGRARRHLRDCSPCREYRQEMRRLQRSFAALIPAGAGPLGLLGLTGHGGGAAAAGGGAAASGGVVGGVSSLTATKVCAVVCSVVVTAGGAVEVERQLDQRTSGERAPRSAAGPETRGTVAAPAARRSAAPARRSSGAVSRAGRRPAPARVRGRGALADAEAGGPVSHHPVIGSLIAGDAAPGDPGAESEDAATETHPAPQPAPAPAPATTLLPGVVGPAPSSEPSGSSTPPAEPSS